MKKSKVIVTGGTGYIGSHTVVELIEQNYEPIIVDNLSNSQIGVLDGIYKTTGTKVTFEKVDLKNAEESSAFFEKYNDAIGVIHFAALKAVGESVDLPVAYYKNNILSLLHVLENMNKFNIPYIIFSSSCTVYGQAEELPVTEATPVQKAESPYGYSKQVGERVISDFVNANKKFNGIILRYFNPIGAHEKGFIGERPVGTPNNLLPYLTQVASGIRKELLVFGNDYNTPDGTPIRDYLHVVDLAKAHVKSIQRLESNHNEANYEIFNLGTGTGYGVMDIINAFEKSTGVKINYRYVDRRSGDVEIVYSDPKKANEILGWKAMKTIEEMTASAWAWEQKLKEEKS
ncbi:MAG: UDP-glucose 4-epimerase GalE [Saprospiraceae bacterium]|nr:UDP-glucose 4-epimerase GalE [Saprospiraceae bacterium]